MATTVSSLPWATYATRLHPYLRKCCWRTHPAHTEVGVGVAQGCWDTHCQLRKNDHTPHRSRCLAPSRSTPRQCSLGLHHAVHVNNHAGHALLKYVYLRAVLSSLHTTTHCEGARLLPSSVSTNSSAPAAQTNLQPPRARC